VDAEHLGGPPDFPPGPGHGAFDLLHPRGPDRGGVEAASGIPGDGGGRRRPRSGLCAPRSAARRGCAAPGRSRATGTG
jgi:hypothetical protein